MHGMTTPHCGYCGRPVIGPAIYAGGLAYHNECTRGPGGSATYQAPPLTAEMVRQIVREELAQPTAKPRRNTTTAAEHDAATALPYDEKFLHHPDTGAGWKCYVCGYGGAANNYANTFCVNCTDEDG